MADPKAPVTISAGHLSCGVTPAVGGGITHLTCDGVDLMRRAPADAASPLVLANFPLVPFSGRIRNGNCTIDGDRLDLPVNMEGCPHWLHGHGWHVAWTVLAHDAASLELGFDHAKDSWPFPYRARQRFALDADGLTTTLSVTNTGAKVMPAGLGQHPYFPKPPGTVLTTTVTDVLMPDAANIPIARVPVPPAWDFSRSLKLDDVVVDHCFGGFGGKAVLAWPNGLALTITADPLFGNLVVYSPWGADFVCVEPVSQIPDAVNWQGPGPSGLTRLEPGATLSGSMRFALSRS